MEKKKAALIVIGFFAFAVFAVFFLLSRFFPIAAVTEGGGETAESGAPVSQAFFSSKLKIFTFGPSSEEQQPLNGSCCFCVYDDQRDRDRFLTECRLFFAGKAHPNDAAFRCDIRETVPISQSEERIPELFKKYQCDKQPYIYHAEHGPVCKNIVSLALLCATSAPTCDINLKSLSCSSFKDLEGVTKEFKKIQKQLGPDTKLTVCGNRLDARFEYTACTLTHTFTVSQGEMTDMPGPCQPQGTLCSPPHEQSIACINARGQRTTQLCCRNATRLSQYEQYTLDTGQIPPSSTELSAEGADSCPLAPCAQDGASCSSVGKTWGCIAPEGVLANQSCCAVDTQQQNGTFSALGGSCALPACTNTGTFCREGGARIPCRDALGAETFQTCCGIRLSNSLSLHGILSDSGSACKCGSGIVAELSAINCFSATKMSASAQNYCEYTLAPERSFCGVYKNRLCDASGHCLETAEIPCSTNADCYRDGKRYCSFTSSIPGSFHWRAVVRQKCVHGVCAIDHIKQCRSTEECRETKSGASCIRMRAASKGTIVAITEELEDIFG